MITIYIVFYNNAMCWAFETRKQAEDYIRECMRQSNDNRVYTQSNLTIKAVDMFHSIPGNSAA